MSLVPPTLVLLAQTAAADRLAAARDGLDLPITERLIGLLGIATMLGIAFLLAHRLEARRLGARPASRLRHHRAQDRGRTRRLPARWRIITALLGFQEQGARFVFGNLVQSCGAGGAGRWQLAPRLAWRSWRRPARSSRSTCCPRSSSSPR
jgi:hypothetical protein